MEYTSIQARGLAPSKPENKMNAYAKKSNEDGGCIPVVNGWIIQNDWAVKGDEWRKATNEEKEEAEKVCREFFGLTQ